MALTQLKRTTVYFGTLCLFMTLETVGEHILKQNLSNLVAKLNKRVQWESSQIKGQAGRKWPTDWGQSYVATQSSRSEHKEIKMIITSKVDIMFDVLSG